MLMGKKIVFIGAGVMGEAMFKGLLREQLVKASDLTISDPNTLRREQLVQVYEMNAVEDNRAAIHNHDVIVLSVKPQVMPAVLSNLRGAVPSTALVISIAAGVPIRTISDGLAHAAVVRAMPNTPGQIGEGITVWCPTEHVTEEQFAQSDLLLGALGESVRVNDESYLDMATALSGTGPAYILMFMEAMIDAGVHLGFSRRVAEKLVMQTMQGTLSYARQSQAHQAALRNEVTSPGGTTAEAIFELERGGLRTVVSQAIWAAYRRSVELGSGQPRNLDRG